MAPPTKVFPGTVKSYYCDDNHSVNEQSPVRQITQYECNLSNVKMVTCIPIDRFFRVYVLDSNADEVQRMEALLRLEVTIAYHSHTYSYATSYK